METVGLDVAGQSLASGEYGFLGIAVLILCITVAGLFYFYSQEIKSNRKKDEKRRLEDLELQKEMVSVIHRNTTSTDLLTEKIKEVLTEIRK